MNDADRKLIADLTNSIRELRVDLCSEQHTIQELQRKGNKFAAMTVSLAVTRLVIELGIFAALVYSILERLG